MIPCFFKDIHVGTRLLETKRFFATFREKCRESSSIDALHNGTISKEQINGLKYLDPIIRPDCTFHICIYLKKNNTDCENLIVKRNKKKKRREERKNIHIHTRSS